MMVPGPLDYATPEVDRRRPFHGDISVIILGMLQLLVAVLVLAAGSFQPHVREAAWYAHLAFHWVIAVGGLNAAASILVLRGALCLKGERRRLYTLGTTLMLVAALVLWLSFRILFSAEIYWANGPATVPVNDPRYRMTFDESRDAGVAMVWMCPVLILFSLRELGRCRVAMLSRVFRHPTPIPTHLLMTAPLDRVEQSSHGCRSGATVGDDPLSGQ